MDTFLQQILSLITTPPGNLSYHMVLTFTIAAALSMAVQNWRSSQFPQARRAVIGLSILLAARLIIFLAAGLVWQGIGSAHTLLPLLDRASDVASILVIGWLWTLPEAVGRADYAIGLIGLLILTMLGLSLAIWGGENASIAFNAFWLDAAWAGFALVLIIAHSVFVSIRRPSGWETGLIMMLVLAAGEILQLIIPQINSDFSGSIRLAQMATYPLLMLISQRFPVRTAQVTHSHKPESRPIIKERRQFTADPKTFSSLIGLLSKQDSQKIWVHVSKAIAQTVVADICLLIGAPDQQGQMIVFGGYDLIREAALEGGILTAKEAPTLASALKRGKTLRLPASSTSPDLRGLGSLLGLGVSGHMMVVPLKSKEEPVLAGLALLSPYSQRPWSQDDQIYLQAATPSLATLLEHSTREAQRKEQLDQLESRLEKNQAEMEALQQENESLKSQLQPSSDETPQGEMEMLLAELEKASELVNQLQRENNELYQSLQESEKTTGSPESGNTQHMEGELRLALEEIAQLRNLLAKTQMQLEEAQQQTSTPEGDGISVTQTEMITSLAQDLRQPMSSIVGYTDLLLGESVGILGAMQRKFLDRISTSTQRMEKLLNDLINVVTLDQDDEQYQPGPVALSQVIDEAIAQLSQQLREKNIVLSIDLPEHLPEIFANHDALQQILVNLLSNAGLASPQEGKIVLRAREEETAPNERHALVQITDSGGGIPEEDQPRVFSRLYRADNPLIQGVGDTGVGLSIAKALITNQGGRIWVESKMGEGATFSILLPLSQSPSPNIPEAAQAK